MIQSNFKESTVESEKQKNFLDALEQVHSRLWRYCEALCKNQHDAEDLVSETLLRTYQQFESIKSEESFVYYLFTIARRLHRKRKWKLRFFSELTEEQTETHQSTNSLPDIEADISALYQALDTLPQTMKEAVIMFEIADMTLEEIRTIQGGTLSGVKSRVTRGRERIANLLR